MCSSILRTSLCAVAAATLLTGAAGAGVVVSTFDTGDEGWSFLNDARDFAWTDQEGNPAGAITARDRSTGVIWYYAAPTAYLGDQSALLGGTLSWEILGITGNQTTVSGIADVMLVGGGLSIGINSGVQPVNGTWVASGVTLSDASGWQLVTLGNGTLSGATVSAADFQMVLANLTGLYIRGEYTSGADATALDNVQLVPTPGAIVLLGGCGVLGMRRRR